MKNKTKVCIIFSDSTIQQILSNNKEIDIVIVDYGVLGEFGDGNTDNLVSEKFQPDVYSENI